MAKNLHGKKSNGKTPIVAQKTFDAAALEILLEKAAEKGARNALQKWQTAQPEATNSAAPSTELVPVKDTLPAVPEDLPKRSRPGLVLLGLIQGLDFVHGTLKLAQSTFCKDVETELAKNNLEALLAAGTGLGLSFVRPDHLKENTIVAVFVGKTFGQPLGKLVITSVNSVLGWSQEKIEACQKKLDAMRIALVKDASFNDVANPELKADIARGVLAGKITMMPPVAMPDQGEAAQPVAVVKAKAQSFKTGSGS